MQELFIDFNDIPFLNVAADINYTLILFQLIL